MGNPGLQGITEQAGQSGRSGLLVVAVPTDKCMDYHRQAQVSLARGLR